MVSLPPRPGTGRKPPGGKTVVKPPPNKRPLAASLGDRRRYIHFYGQAFGDSTSYFQFDALSGDQPPTIMDGYAQWSLVQMPLRVGLITFTGRNPISAQFSLRFMRFDTAGGWLTDDAAATAIEFDIGKLEWMAGEGITVGPSPLINITTYDGNGNTIPLLPFEYQSATGTNPSMFRGEIGYNPRWIINGLTWDSAPIRTAKGFRVRQDATVTATMYEAPAGSKPQGPARPKGRTFISRAGADTALRIARAAGVPSTEPQFLAQAIIKAPQNKKLRLRSVMTPIKHGKKVFIPSTTASNA